MCDPSFTFWMGRLGGACGGEEGEVGEEGDRAECEDGLAG